MKAWPGIVLLLLAGCAQPKGRGIADEDASFKIPAMKAAAQRGDEKAIPQLVEDLNSNDPAVRFYAIEALRRLTGQTMDYHYFDDETARAPAIERWEKWLKEHK